MLDPDQELFPGVERAACLAAEEFSVMYRTDGYRISVGNDEFSGRLCERLDRAGGGLVTHDIPEEQNNKSVYAIRNWCVNDQAPKYGVLSLIVYGLLEKISGHSSVRKRPWLTAPVIRIGNINRGNSSRHDNDAGSRAVTLRP